MPILSRVQQNELFNEAKRIGLEPSDFEWSTNRPKSENDDPEDIFAHRPTQSRMSFSFYHNGQFWVTWWPVLGSAEKCGFFPRWIDVFVHAREWLAEVKKNHDAPDLWSEAQKARLLTDAAGHLNGDNTPFNLDEIERLKPKLNEVEAYITSRQPLDEQQKKQIHGRFQYLLDAARRKVGRIDWLNIFVRQIVQIFTDGVLNSSLYGDVMRHASTALAGALRLGSRLLGP